MPQDKEGFKEIRLTFPIDVQITLEQTEALMKVVDEINTNNCPDGYVMWNSGGGCLPLSMNIPEFDDSVFVLETSIKEKTDERKSKIGEFRELQKECSVIEKHDLDISRATLLLTRFIEEGLAKGCDTTVIFKFNMWTRKLLNESKAKISFIREKMKEIMNKVK